MKAEERQTALRRLHPTVRTPLPGERGRLSGEFLPGSRGMSDELAIGIEDQVISLKQRNSESFALPGDFAYRLRVEITVE